MGGFFVLLQNINLLRKLFRKTRLKNVLLNGGTTTAARARMAVVLWGLAPIPSLKKGMVLNSRLWVKRVKDLIVEAKDRGEAVWLKVEG